FLELLTRVGVFDGEAEACFRRASATGAERCPSEIQYGERDPQSFAQWSEDIFLWHRNIVQTKPRRCRATNSEFWHPGVDHFLAIQNKLRSIGARGRRHPHIRGIGTGIAFG